MEIPYGESLVVQMCMREFLGTAALVFSVNASQGKTEAVAGTLFANIMMFAGRFNGGHFNPAVTLAVMAREGRANFKKNIPIVWLIIMF